MACVKIDNRKITGGVVSTPGINTNVYYRRDGDDQFQIAGAYNNQETLYDWAIVNSKESKYLKTGVVKLRANRRSLTVEFKSPFVSSEYYLFYTSSGNVNLYTVDKRASRFTINASFDISEEISWVAVHKSLATKTGINNPGTIYSGQRELKAATTSAIERSPGVLYDCLDINVEEHANLDGWYQNEYIIKPTVALDGIPSEMNLNDYSVLVTINGNINIYWNEKISDRAKISASFPRSCIIDYLFIKEGINWWDEF